MKPFRRTAAARRMKRHQVRAAVALAQTLRHRTDDFLLLVVVHAAVATENPDQPRVLVTLAQPLAIDLGVGCGEKRFAPLIGVVPEAAPRREEADVESAFVRFGHDEVHVIPIVILRPVLHGGLGDIEIRERQMAVGIRVGVALEFRDGDGLEHVELTRRAIVEELDRLLTVQPVKELPGRVAEVEERLAVGSDEEAFVLGNFERRQGGLRQAERQRERGENGQWIHGGEHVAPRPAATRTRQKEFLDEIYRSTSARNSLGVRPNPRLKRLSK